MKPTTVRLPEGLMAKAKRVARERNTTVTALIEEGLREVVSRKPNRAARTLPPVSSVYGSAPPNLDIADSAAVQEFMDLDVVMQARLVKLR